MNRQQTVTRPPSPCGSNPGTSQDSKTFRTPKRPQVNYSADTFQRHPLWCRTGVGKPQPGPRLAPARAEQPAERRPPLRGREERAETVSSRVKSRGIRTFAVANTAASGASSVLRCRCGSFSAERLPRGARGLRGLAPATWPSRKKPANPWSRTRMLFQIRSATTLYASCSKFKVQHMCSYTHTVHL